MNKNFMTIEHCLSQCEQQSSDSLVSEHSQLMANCAIYLNELLALKKQEPTCYTYQEELIFAKKNEDKESGGFWIGKPTYPYRVVYLYAMPVPSDKGVVKLSSCGYTDDGNWRLVPVKPTLEMTEGLFFNEHHLFRRLYEHGIKNAPNKSL